MNSLWKALTSGSIVCRLIKTQPSTICTFLLKRCPATERRLFSESSRGHLIFQKDSSFNEGAQLAGRGCTAIAVTVCTAFKVFVFKLLYHFTSEMAYIVSVFYISTSLNAHTIWFPCPRSDVQFFSLHFFKVKVCNCYHDMIFLCAWYEFGVSYTACYLRFNINSVLALPSPPKISWKIKVKVGIPGHCLF